MQTHVLGIPFQDIKFTTLGKMPDFSIFSTTIKRDVKSKQGKVNNK
jgi:hypothetical protein